MIAVVLAVILDPCALLTKDDVARLTGWTPQKISKRRYHMPQEAGGICAIDSPEGLVVVTAPDGTGVSIGSGVFANPLAAGNDVDVEIPDGSASIFNNSIYIAKHHRHVVVKMLPNDAQATQEQLTAAARLVAKRMP